jgi:hypothetical protein
MRGFLFLLGGKIEWRDVVVVRVVDVVKLPLQAFCCRHADGSAYGCPASREKRLHARATATEARHI